LKELLCKKEHGQKIEVRREREPSKVINHDGCLESLQREGRARPDPRAVRARKRGM